MGQWSNELDGGDVITEIVCAGAKTYTYKTHKGKRSVRMKGITLDRQNEDIFTFEAMKDMVLNSTVLRSAPRSQFITNEMAVNIGQDDR